MADRLSQEDARRITAAGAAAMRSGKSYLTVPYDPDSPRQANRLRARAWLTGWIRAKRATRTARQ